MKIVIKQGSNEVYTTTSMKDTMAIIKGLLELSGYCVTTTANGKLVTNETITIELSELPNR